MRQDWTDDRLDDLSHRMDERFDQVEAEMDQRFERVEGEVKSQSRELRAEIVGVEARIRSHSSEHYARTGEEFARVRGELATLHQDKQQLLAEMQALHRTLIQIGWTGAIALVGTLAGVLIAHL